MAGDNALELALRPLPHSCSEDKKATHAYWGSGSQCSPSHYLRRETRNRVMPLLPGVRSCGRHGDRQSPSTRDDPELLRADVALSLTRPLRLPRIRQTLDAAGKTLKNERLREGREKEARKASTVLSVRASAGARGGKSANTSL